MQEMPITANDEPIIATLTEPFDARKRATCLAFALGLAAMAITVAANTWAAPTPLSWKPIAAAAIVMGLLVGAGYLIHEAVTRTSRTWRIRRSGLELIEQSPRALRSSRFGYAGITTADVDTITERSGITWRVVITLKEGTPQTLPAQSRHEDAEQLAAFIRSAAT